MLMLMLAIPSPALALTRAFGRLERSSARVVAAAQGAQDADLGAALVEQIEAKVEVKAALAQVRFADEMWKALLNLDDEAP